MQLAATTFALSSVDVELVAGDLTAPVSDREFDLVVCNPPFVIGPVARYAYRDASWSRAAESGDATSRAAVRAAAEALADGGVAQLLVNWLHVRGEDWRDRVGEWVADLGVDAFLLERDVASVPDYVATWLADAGEADDDAAAEAWTSWFAREQVEAVGFGWVVVRRGSAPHRIAVESLTHAVDQPLGPAFDDWLVRSDWLRAADDAVILGHAFRAAPELRRDVASVPGDDGWTPVGGALRLDAGLRWSLPCDEPTAALVAGCDGRRPLGGLASVLAAALGVAPAAIEAEVCATVRGLVDRGLLLP